ncbi:hypothetical protein A6779_13675 [Marinobacter adhaerens]|jgi:hypothetical protein|uniref:Rap1a/Tai family immunity protein n=1 Tax=Marinobacter adhaerens TaxID=1033846 RepID=UPI000840CC36|nr:Rap1a/Tai family immunity protein [Marinobacter adhaerens]ODM29032.1 hypothetical protein A6779_13675 [Marinobacter adhaerens]
MRPFISIYALAFLVGLATTSAAQEKKFSGVNLLEACSKAEEYLDNGSLQDVERINQATYCLGVLGGISGYNGTMAELDRDHLYCSPSDVTAPQQVRIVVKFLEGNPQLLNENGFALAIVSLSQAFPCTE